MSLFQGYANSDGRVRINPGGKVPAGAATDRGMIVAGNRVIPYVLDTGGPRVFQGGLAFDTATGLLLAVTTPFGATNTVMGGLQVDSRGAVVIKDGVGDIIWQGVGLATQGQLATAEEPVALFMAKLRASVNGSHAPATFIRASEGLYLGADGAWRVARAGEPRYENNMLLMEPAITNKCECFSFPDSLLTGYVKTAQGVMTRELGQPDELSNIGNGYCVRLSTVGTGAARIDVAGFTGNTNRHVYSAYARKISGQNVARLQGLTDSAGIEITSPNWERIFFDKIPLGTGEKVSLFCGADVVAEFLFPQLVESTVLSSPIITQGAAASRAKDELDWPLQGLPGRVLTINPGLNNFAEGWVTGGGESCTPLKIRESSVRIEGATQGDCLICRRDNVTFTQGKWYRIRLRLTEFSANPPGNVYVRLGAINTRLKFNKAGEYEEYYYLSNSPTNTRQQLNFDNPANGFVEVDFFEVTELENAFNQTEGMVIATWVPQFNATDTPLGTASQQGILNTRLTTNTGLMQCLRTAGGANDFQTTQATGNNPTVAVPDFSPGDVFRVAVRWKTTPGELQIGFSLNGGAWVWSAEVVYNGSFNADQEYGAGLFLDFPQYFSDFRVYSEDKGAAWIEANA